MYRVLAIVLCLCYFVEGEVGESCTRNGSQGTCLLLSNCRPALDALQKKRVFPQVCSFVGNEAVVCCAGYSTGTTTTPAPVRTTPKIKPTSPPEEDPVYVSLDPSVNQDECEAIPKNLTAKPSGQKAWDKCIEYQHSLVYPCLQSTTLIGGKQRTNRCFHKVDDLIIGGENAAPNEFPHMVLVGFGSQPSVNWLCGGTLISEQFVLTAGHCTFSRDAGPATYALMGTLKRSEVDPAKVRRISRIIPHPQYKAPSKYHDIALLKLETPVKLSEYLVPACLHVPSLESAGAPRAAATGWGHTRNRQPDSAALHLQKVVLNEYPAAHCVRVFPTHRHLARGFDETTQICYGDPTKDTCQGDSGGPLQIKSKKLSCMYMVIGVTSFGAQCGQGDPGVYTRVSQYVSWIEREVWP